MINEFQQWLEEVRDETVAWKKEHATDPATWKEVEWPAPKKNRDIKNKFRDKIAAKRDENGRQLYFSRPSYVANTGEWLYDYVARRLDENNDLLEVFVAMEIEISNPHEPKRRYDFNKLLQADSRYKIFVFQQKSRKDVDAAMETLKEAAGKYFFRSDSEFLLCGWSTDANEFIFDTFIAKRQQ